MLAPGNALGRGQGAEDRADHQPADALGLLCGVVAALGILEGAPPRLFPAAHRAEEASTHAPEQGPRLGEAVFVTELLARAQRLLCVGDDVLARAAERVKGAAAEQCPRRWRRRMLERLLEDAHALGDVSVRRPEAPQRGGRAREQVELPGLASPVDRGAQVRVVFFEPGQDRRLASSPRLVVEGLRHREEVLRMTPLRILERAVRLQSVYRELADRLEHPESRLGVGIGPLAQEALLEERVEAVDDPAPETIWSDYFRRVGTAAADEDAEASREASAAAHRGPARRRSGA